MIIRRHLRWLTFIGACGLLVFGAFAFTTLYQIEVNGPLYKTISLSNNLIANYVPPSESLLEPALLCARLTAAPDQRSRRRYEESLRTFRLEYDRQYGDYMVRIPEGKLKAMMRGEAYETAQEYFGLADRLVALVNQDHMDEARGLLVSTMNPLYERHAAAVEQIVAQANEEARATEALAAHSVRLFTTAMVAIGLLVLITTGTFSWAIARGISAEANKLMLSEESRSRQAQLLQAVLSSIAEGLVTVDDQGNIYVWNEEAERLLGPSPVKFDESWAASMNMYLADGVTLCPLESSPLFQAIRGHEAHAELLLENPQHKTIHWIEVNVRPVKVASGATTGGVAVFRDTTERHEMVVALHHSEERYRATFEQAAVGIVHVSFEGEILQCNPRFAQIVGYPIEEILGKTFQQFTPPEYRAGSAEAFQQLVTGAINTAGLEKSYVRKDGTLSWVRLTSSVQHDASGRALHLVAFMEDITARKAAEDHLDTATNALQTSEARYRTIFQTSRDALSISRMSDGTYIEVNNAFLDIVGFEREELIGQTASSLGIWADLKDRDNVVEMLRQNSSFRDERTRLTRRNGEVFWILLSASVMEIDGTPCIFAATRDISDAKAAEDEIRNLAFYDPLTRLPNRRLLLDRMLQAVSGDSRSNRKKALLFVDLDDFKTLNDTLGHSIGDLLLQEVAQRLSACVGEADTVARFGADEFVVMLEGLSEASKDAADEAEAIGEKILAAVSRPYLLSDHGCRSSASIGVTLFGEKRESTNKLLQQTNIAMDQAKAAGGNTIRFFAPDLQAAVNARAAMKEDLSKAIGANQFLLYYQPQVDSTGLIGAEVLMRWIHPVRGLIPPGEFISLAEETGDILSMGSWALETACMQIAAWSGRDTSAHLQIAVNISARQFRLPDFVEHILATLERTGANPKNLKLELTESMLVDDIEAVIAKMTMLKSHGVSFALDDFGTGYSSLSYLKRLPLDQLKIDRAFVHDILDDVASAAIARSIISLGQAMNMSVIAEGVETEEQQKFLASLGTHSFQGYLFSRPLPLEEFERLWIDPIKYAASIQA